MKTSPVRRAFRLASSEVASGMTKPKPSRCMVRRPTSMLRGIRSQVLGFRCQGRSPAPGLGADGREPALSLPKGRPSLHLLQILLLDNSPMMQFVSGDDVGQGAHRDLVTGGRTA